MKENLSAFIDGELDHAESIQMVTRLDKDKQLRQHWGRYQAYGSALRDELTPALSVDFSARVCQRLAEEPVQFAPAAMPKARRLRGPLAGIAVAASLLGIAIILQQPVLESTQEKQATTIAEVSDPLPLAASDAINAAASSNDADQLIVSNSRNENIRAKINRLLVEHNEYNPAGDMTGMLPYSRFVGYNPGIDNPGIDNPE